MALTFYNQFRTYKMRYISEFFKAFSIFALIYILKKSFYNSKNCKSENNIIFI